MKTNEDLQRDVQNAIKWEPLLNAAEIGVTAIDGVITLSGTVNSYAKKKEAENAAKNVAGVKIVAETIKIHFGGTSKQNDTEIAREILNAWKWNWEVPDDKIKVKVEDGLVTLEGEVRWNYQKEAAQKSVSTLLGVLGVINNIAIHSQTTDQVEKGAIERALNRSWSIDAEDIGVNVKGNNVTLTGSVNSIYKRDEAGRIAWNAPGVSKVKNDILVEFE
ncbi:MULTISPECIES: BON domain-containing protein [Pedobacter]|uniref:Osmotically-inducible protein OsmY n=1 Tax=Pedobacter cryoconitis TaxID=188932 RepID=A0A327S1M2_9SPHI|nr:BON domain-containing protein [Pedobacter cryoconitis]MBB5638362.1 osmotically-inducible protein OsmY [Pedobacter cryoconitis]RAJ22615.1 osmotically-inducible protein OsmY [Pedobacter cryoconitis]